MSTTESTWVHAWSTPGQYSFARGYHHVNFFAGKNQVGSVIFQDGPVHEHGYNGTTNEEVLAALIERLEALNQPPYDSDYNQSALNHLRQALAWLKKRTADRQARGVEGTSTP